MPHHRALLVDFEGIDGAGKGTQAMRLLEDLRAAGRTVQLISFPRYSETVFGRGIADFLNGRFGPLALVDPFLAALLFAGDRFESRELLRTALAENDVVILDRYVASNMAHQGSKRDGSERAELIGWIEQIEYEIYGLPRPDRVILLDLPPDEAQRLIASKRPRDYTTQAADLQEADLAHLTRTRQTYLDLAGNRADWCVIPVCGSQELRSRDEIAAEIRGRLEAVL